MGHLARATRDAVLEQRHDVWHRVTDLVEAALALEAGSGSGARAGVCAPDEVLMRRLRVAR